MENYILLDEVSSDGAVKLMDGSIWETYPVDLPTVLIWLPTAKIQVQHINDQEFGWRLINLDTNTSASAMKRN